MRQAAWALVVVCFSVATNGLASRSALTALTPTAPSDAVDAPASANHAAVQHTVSASAPVHPAVGFARIQDMMHDLDSQLDSAVEHEYSLAQTAERTKRARDAVHASHWGTAASDASADEAESAAATARVATGVITPVVGGAATALVAEKSSVALTSEHAADANSEASEDAPAHRSMRLTDVAPSSFVETSAMAKPKDGAAKTGGDKAAAGGKKGKKDNTLKLTDKAKSAGAAASSASTANLGLERLHHVPLVPKDMDPLTGMEPLQDDLGLSHVLNSPLLNARGTDAARDLPAGTTAKAAAAALGLGQRAAVTKSMDSAWLAADNADGNPFTLEAHAHMSPAQHAAAHLDERVGLPSDPFHVFTLADADPLHRGADWIHPEVMERGTLMHYLSTAENAIAASSKLYHSYSESLNHLMNQIRLYKPNVAEWVNQQKVKAVETVEGVKETLRSFRPQMRELERVYTDALAKERYYRKQIQQMQAERMLQTSSPTVAAVESSMMPNDKYTAALDTLNHFLGQAAKVRSDAQAALLAKKKAIKDGKQWLVSSHDTLMSWLKRQHKHLKLVLKQARSVATEWQHSLHEFRTVHLQATHLVRQYQLALRRMDLEDQLRRLRLAWKTYEVRNHNGVASADGHASAHEMTLKFGALHHALHDLAHQQTWHGAPPAPPANWLSILSADPQPKSSVPLSSPPLPQPLSDASERNFLRAPVPAVEAAHIAGSEPMNHLLDPLNVPSGHIGVYPHPSTYPHTDLNGNAHVHDLYPDLHLVVPGVPGSGTPIPGSSTIAPANPPAALYKQPAAASDDKEAKKKDDSESGGDSFLQKAAALSHAISTGFSDSVFVGTAAPPAALALHPANPTTHSAFFDSAPLFSLPASLTAAVQQQMVAMAPQPPPQPMPQPQAAAAQQPMTMTTSSMMAPPPQRHGIVPPPPGAVAPAAMNGAAMGRPPVRHAVAPQLPVLPPPPLASSVDVDVDIL